MASQWYSLVTQKLFLARTLLEQADQTTEAARQEALRQGAIELMLRARRLFLAMIAHYHQKPQAAPATLDELAALVGARAPEVEQLAALAARAGNWWSHLDQLEAGQSRPPAPRKAATADNLIAVTGDSGPDRSTEELRKTLAAFRQFAQDLNEWHNEW